MKRYNRTSWCSWPELQRTLDTHQEWHVINIIEHCRDYCAFYYDENETPVVDTNKKKI